MTPAPALPPGHALGAMRADEVPTLVGWAADLGWNPGLADVGIAWELDPDAFLALRDGDELVGGGTILSYDGAYGFMGLFIVREDRRGAGLGRALWLHRRDRLVARLRPGATIGMDGVFAMVPFYARGGFAFAHRDLRFEGVARGAPDPALVEVSALPFAAVDAYDRGHAAAPRGPLLRRWLEAPGVRALAAVEGGELVGMAALRPCRRGHRFGPVHARTPALAGRLVRALLAQVEGEPVQLDVPEPNAAALALARELGLREVFGCARMYLGPAPAVPMERIFGVTSFELG